MQIILKDSALYSCKFNFFNSSQVYYDFNSNYLTQNIWYDFRSNPYFIIKSYPDENNNNYYDAIVRGILDFGGKDAKANINIDNGGKNAELKLTKSTEYSNINMLYDIELVSGGFGYTNIDYIVCSFIHYEIDNIENSTNYLNIIKSKTRILEQFKVKITNNGLDLGLNNQILWDYTTNTKSYNKIKIVQSNLANSGDDVNKIYTINNEFHSSTSKYALLVGGIPDSNLDIINSGSLYGSEINTTDLWVPIDKNATIIKGSDILIPSSDLRSYISINNNILLENNIYKVKNITAVSITLDQQYKGVAKNQNGIISFLDTYFPLDMSVTTNNNSKNIQTSIDLSNILSNDSLIKINYINYHIDTINGKDIVLTTNYNELSSNNSIISFNIDFKILLSTIGIGPNIYTSILPNFNSTRSVFRSINDTLGNTMSSTSQIENEEIVKININIPKDENNFLIPLVEYNVNTKKFEIIKPSVKIGSQLTGFTVYSTGNSLHPNRAKIYNGLTTNIQIKNKGSLYLDNPKIIQKSIKDPNISINVNTELDGGGNGAIINPVIENGSVVDIKILNSGKNYRFSPKISINDENGSGAELKAN